MKKLALIIAMLGCAGGIAKGACAAGSDLVLVANRGVAISQINQDQLTQIFLGQMKSWPDTTPVAPVDWSEGTSERKSFYGDVLHRSLGQVRAYWARQEFTGNGYPPPKMSTADAILQFVKATPGAVAYVERSQVNGTVKVIAVTP